MTAPKTLAAGRQSLAKVAGISPSPKTSGNPGPPRVAEHVSLTPAKTTQAALNAKAAKPKG
jgi:hypothetical protein